MKKKKILELDPAWQSKPKKPTPKLPKISTGIVNFSYVTNRHLQKILCFLYSFIN
jgi:hypothetical protein